MAEAEELAERHRQRMADDTITPDLDEEIKALVAMSDDDIDTTDIPGIKDWTGAVRGKFFVKLTHMAKKTKPKEKKP
jgi:hypothetical protein